MFTRRAVLKAIAPACTMVMLTGWGLAKSATSITTGFDVLDVHDHPLRDDFNRGVGRVRLMFLVDPICPECLRGMADIDRDLLSKLPQSAQLEVFVVHEPVIGGAVKDISAAARLLHTTLVRHYWNPSGEFGRQVSAAFGLRRGDRPIYAWDIWMIYPPNVVWDSAEPPPPQLLMHQLSSLGGSSQFPYLDSRVFANEVQHLLAQFETAK